MFENETILANKPEIGSLQWHADYLESFRKPLLASMMKRAEPEGMTRVARKLTTADGSFVMPGTFGYELDGRIKFLWFGARDVLLWGIEEFQANPDDAQSRLYAFRALLQVKGYTATLGVLSTMDEAENHPFATRGDGFDIITRDAYDVLKNALEAVIRGGK